MANFEEVTQTTVQDARQAQECLQAQKTKNQFKRNQLAFVWGWLALPIVAWIVFYWYVNFSSFVQAFQHPSSGKFSMYNFQRLWEEIIGKNGSAGSFLIALANTGKYFLLDIFVKYPIQIIVCYFLYKQIAGYKIYRFIFYLPAILPGVALTTAFKEGILGSYGLLSTFGVTQPANGFLGNPATATSTVMIYTVWLCVSGHMLLLCGAMNRIPVDVLEAARLDGIKPARELVSIIIPMIWPTLSTLLVLTCCGILGATGPILLLVGQNEAYTAKAVTINHWIYEKVLVGRVGDNSGNYNLVSAAGMLLTVVTVPCVLGLRKLLDLIPTVDY